MNWNALRRAFAAALLGAVAVVADAATPAAVPATEYTRWPDVFAVTVSPSNAHAAMLVTAPGGRIALAVVDLADPSRRRVVASYADVDVREAAWVNDRRLVYAVIAPGSMVDYEKWGTMAIDLDGSDERHLISARSDNEAATGSLIRTRVLPRGWDYWKPVGDGSDDVFVTRWLDSAEYGFRPQVLARVDTRTLTLRTLSDGQPAGAYRWLIDAEGRLRVVSAALQGRSQLWWKPAADAPWTKLHDGDLYEDRGYMPLALERDGTLVVAAREGRDTTAIHTLNPATNKLDPQPLVAVDGFDVDRVRFDARAGQVIGVDVHAQRPTAVWFDEGLARAQAAVDRALPAGRSNRLLCGHCMGAKRLVVASGSDRQPGEYYLYDVAAGRLTPLAMQRPALAEASQGRRSFHRIAARDGLPLPVVVTHPAGAAADTPAPSVVLVHGGPWEAGADTLWDAEAQFLASRGYRVLEVSFRGTTGLGWRHERASWGEWGLAMQDDLEDALLWAVKERLADPARVCIVGASYGGYAALMGPVRHPGRYRCAVSHVGVTDLTLMYSANWTDVSPAGRRYGYGRLIGDPVRDAERLRRQSPVHRVAEIKVPVLVVQGRLDRRVTPEHADRFVGAARAAGVDIERVDYQEGHGFAVPETRADYWERLDAFLARHLKAGR